MRIRSRLLFTGVALFAVLLVTALAYVLIPELLQDADGQVASGQAAILVAQVRAGVLWTGVVAAALAVFGALWVGDLLARPLEIVRRGVGRLPEVGTAPVTVVAEVDALAAAVERAGNELRERLRRVRTEADEARRLLDAVGEGIMQLDLAGRVIRYNPAARTLLRLPVGADGEPYETVIRNLQLRAAIDAGLRGTGARTGELRSDDRVLVYTLEPMRDTGAGDAVLGLALTLLDITHMRRLETVRRDFVANASHELKTPLTSIRGYAETLLGDDVPGDVRRRFLGTIAENAQRLQHIVDDLLDLSRIESGGWTPELSPVHLEQAAAEAWEPLAARAEQRHIDFRVEDSARVEVEADETALRQIFTNLFDNAIRHTPSGGSITVRARRIAAPKAPAARPRADAQRPGRVAVEVVDTGSGIPRDALERVFERFYRVDPARSREEGGTGLGLSIVKHMAESMGGAVEAISDLGRGTTIRLVLPAALAGPPGPPLPAEGAAL